MTDILKELKALGDCTEKEEAERMIFLQSRMSQLLLSFIEEHPCFKEKETVRIIATGKVEDLLLDEKLAEAFSECKDNSDDVHFAALAAAYCYDLVGIVRKSQTDWSFACRMLDMIFRHEKQYRRMYPKYMRLAVLLAYMLDYLSWTDGFLLDKSWSGGESFRLHKSLLA